METFLFNIVISLLTTLVSCAALVPEDHVEATDWFSPVFSMWDMEHEEKNVTNPGPLATLQKDCERNQIKNEKNFKNREANYQSWGNPERLSHLLTGKYKPW